MYHGAPLFFSEDEVRKTGARMMAANGREGCGTASDLRFLRDAVRASLIVQKNSAV